MTSIKLPITLICIWTLQNSNPIISAAQINKPIRHTDVAIRENVEDLTKCTYLEAKTFLQLVQNSDLFVDTSLFIKEALDVMNRLNIIVIPSNFGKSINLDMYKNFLQIPLDEEGNPMGEAEFRNASIYKLFKFGEIELENGQKVKLQQRLQISKYDDIIETYVGNLPVIKVDFSKICTHDVSKIEQEIWKAIRQAYQEHTYLVKFLEQNEPEPDALNQFKSILEGNATNVTLPEALVFLSGQLVKKFAKKKVVILIDNEDVPINCLKSHYTITKREIGKIHNLMYKFLKNTFMSNPFLHHGLVTSSEPLTSDSSNYKILKDRNTIKSHDPLSHYFGLTNTTLYLLCDKFKVPVPSWSRDEFLKSDPSKDWWYQGKSWTDEKRDEVFVEFGAVLKYLMKEHEKLRKSAKVSS